MQINIKKLPFPNERINVLFAFLENYAKIVYKRKEYASPEALYNGFNEYIYRRDEYIFQQMRTNLSFSEYMYDLFSRFLENPHCLLSLEDSENPPFLDDAILHKVD